VSLSGQPYSALPTAFKFRTSYDSACTCGSASPSAMEQLTAQSMGVVPDGRPITPVNLPNANATFVPVVPPLAVLVPIPSLRPAASEDPETLADRRGALVPAPVAPDEATVVAGVNADGKPIRVVGPSYFVAR
jgi:Protein of unknown function (DUF2865)